MFLVTRLFFLISILTISCSFKLINDDPTVTQGNVIHSFESGKMQCQSEVDPEGHIFVLLKGLNKNTKVNFFEVVSIKHSVEEEVTFIVRALMEVEEDTNLCARWINLQEVSIEINPLPIKTVSLIGEQVYNSDQITVMLLNTST